MVSVLTIPANHRPDDAPPGYTGLPDESYVPRCPCGWAGFRTLDLPTAQASVRLHQEQRLRDGDGVACEVGQEGLW